MDRGPGFQLDQCLTDGYSTGGTKGIGQARWRGWHRSSMPTRTAEARWCWHSCFPAAHGLCGASGSASTPSRKTACGDVWQLALDGSRCSVLVLDGIGHGESAQQAARAGAEAFGEAPFDAATSVFARMHQAMNGSRGGAAAIAQYDGERQTLAFAGIGNIGASLIGSEGSRGLASHPGIVGVRFARPMCSITRRARRSFCCSSAMVCSRAGACATILV